MSKRTIVCLLAVLIVSAAAGAAWDPAGFSDVQTLEFRTMGPEEGEHWSTVWLVVIDNQIYIRLGSRAAGRMEQNTTKPEVAVRIAGQQFEHVLAHPAPDMKDAVAKAMAAKYWSDLLIRYFDHPLTMRLTPAGT